MGLRRAVLEQHWGYMDQFAGRMVARGPTFSDDGTLTGSVHIVDLPDVIAARVGAGRAEAVTAPSGKREGIPPRNDVYGPQPGGVVVERQELAVRVQRSAARTSADDTRLAVPAGPR